MHQSPVSKILGKDQVKKKAPAKKKVIAPVVITAEEVEDQEFQKRLDWQRNQLLIGASTVKLMNRRKKPPTLEELAKETGLSTKTIQRHQNSKGYDEVQKMLHSVLEMMVSTFVGKVAKSSNDKLWHMFFVLANEKYADWCKMSKVDVTSKGEKISDSIDYSKLSTAALLELANASKDTSGKHNGG